MQAVSRFQLTQEASVLIHSRLLVVICLFVLGFGIRMAYIHEPPLDFHATRQYRSLLIARGYYYESLTSIPEWQKQVADINKERQGILEPPIMELLVATGYRLLGGERFWITRLLSSLFWIIGGVFLYLISRKVADANAALFSIAFYLFLPFAVVASRSFQPDPLMVMLLLASIWAILRYFERPSLRSLALAAAISAAACFVKPVSLFVIFGAFVSLAVYHHGIRKAIIKPALLVFSLATLLPTIIFYSYGIFVAGFLRSQAQTSFLPHLLVDPFFWRGWIHYIYLTIGFPAFIVALLGIMLFRRGQSQSLLVGLWAGYVLYCFVFTYHIATHDYYHLQLVPIVALSLGPMAALIVERLLNTNQDWYWRTLAGFIMLLALMLSIAVSAPQLTSRHFETQVRTAEEIGERVNHSIDIVYLAPDYGFPLQYHGVLSGVAWPFAADLEWERLMGMPTLEAEERFNAWFSQGAPEYFIVLDSYELQQQEDLRRFLERNFPVLVQTDSYMIFDLRHTHR